MVKQRADASQESATVTPMTASLRRRAANRLAGIIGTAGEPLTHDEVCAVGTELVGLAIGRLVTIRLTHICTPP